MFVWVNLMRDGAVVAFLGLMGAGKTMGMVRAALSQSRPIYSNVPILPPAGFAPAATVEYFDQLNSLYGACVCLDELQLIVNAREFAKASALDFAEWLELRIRKRKSCFLFTTQDFEMVDINVRRVCSHIYYHDAIRFQGANASRVVVLRRQMGSMFVKVRDFVMIHSNYYGLYDTTYEDVRIPFTRDDASSSSADIVSSGGQGRAARSVSAAARPSNIISTPDGSEVIQGRSVSRVRFPGS